MMISKHSYGLTRRLDNSSDSKLTDSPEGMFPVDLAAVTPIHHHPRFSRDQSPRHVRLLFPLQDYLA
jgi:hypothetical protein